ncbi:MAG: MFS transporter [Acidobacteria bacterium]|nr:MAG: MFS transporter [Acidobacteriota bacterium]
MQPTRVRWILALLLLAITSLTYLDRLNIMVAAARIAEEFALTEVQIGTILSAFVLGYALFQIPGGILVDVLGPRRLLGLALLWWSMFTILTALVADLPLAQWMGISWAFIVVRFLVGVGEAPALPSANKMIGLWMAPGERALGNGIFIAGLGLGGAVAPPFVVWLMETWGWRASFWVTGLLGLPLLLWWLTSVTDRPEDHPRVNRAELAHIRGSGERAESPTTPSSTPWRLILSRADVWALVGSYFLAGYTAYIFFTWSFLYIVNVRKLPVARAGFWTMTPFLAMAILSLVGGRASDWAAQRWGKTWGRRLPVMSGMSLAGLFLITGSQTSHARLAIVFLALAAGLTGFATVNWWATTVDLTRRFAGSLAGLMNTAGNLGGVVSPTLTPYLAERFGWETALAVAAGTAVLAGALWIFIHPDRPLQEAVMGTGAHHGGKR